MEPKQLFTISVPQEYMSDVITLAAEQEGAVVQNIQQDRETDVDHRKDAGRSEVIKGFSSSQRGFQVHNAGKGDLVLRVRRIREAPDRANAEQDSQGDKEELEGPAAEPLL
jgi:translation elongation factor EF-G